MSDLARLRLRNTHSLFDEFVAGTVSRTAVSDVRGLEKLFAEQLRIAPSYWSQLKSGERHVGEKLARQFEVLSAKPAGWLDEAHATTLQGTAAPEPLAPVDADERFAVRLFLTAYRLNREAVRQRLLDVVEAGADRRVARAPQPEIHARSPLTKIK
jgi:hypothetical protein